MDTSSGIASLVVRHPFLAGLNPRFYRFFAECGQLQTYGTGREIFEEGAPAERFFLIQKGKVTLETEIPVKGRVVIETLVAGQGLGWSWLFEPHYWQFTARAAEPTELIAFDARFLLERADENRDFKNDLVTRVSRSVVARLRATKAELVELYTRAQGKGSGGGQAEGGRTL